jgi:hypothetical protein
MLSAPRPAESRITMAEPRLPCEFVVAHPLHLHRPPRHGTSQERRIDSRVVSAVMAIAARALDVRDRHGLLVELQDHCQAAPELIDALGVRPDMNSVVFHQGHGAGRTEGCVRHVAFGVGRLQPSHGRSGRRSLFFAHDCVLCRLGPEPGMDLVGLGKIGGHAPFCVPAQGLASP